MIRGVREYTLKRREKRKRGEKGKETDTEREMMEVKFNDEKGGRV